MVPYSTNQFGACRHTSWVFPQWHMRLWWRYIPLRNKQQYLYHIYALVMVISCGPHHEEGKQPHNLRAGYA